MNKERSVLTLGVVSSLLISGSLFSALMPITSSFATTSSSCPELPNDGRPQPKKGANEDSQTWKVVRMKGDQSQFKVVDSAGINVADRFDSKANAEQYIAHFVCATSQPTSPSSTETDTEEGGAPSLEGDVVGAPSLEGDVGGPTLPTQPGGGEGEHGGEILPTPEEPGISNVLLPQKCVSYVIPPSFQATTCARIVKYPLASEYKIVAFAEQWIDGNKVYDDVFPKKDVSPSKPCVPPRAIEHVHLPKLKAKNIVRVYLVVRLERSV